MEPQCEVNRGEGLSRAIQTKPTGLGPATTSNEDTELQPDMRRGHSVLQPADGDPDATLPYFQYPGPSLREVDYGQRLTITERFDRNVGGAAGPHVPTQLAGTESQITDVQGDNPRSGQLCYTVEKSAPACGIVYTQFQHRRNTAVSCQLGR